MLKDFDGYMGFVFCIFYLRYFGVGDFVLNEKIY